MERARETCVSRSLRAIRLGLGLALLGPAVLGLVLALLGPARLASALADSAAPSGGAMLSEGNPPPGEIAARPRPFGGWDPVRRAVATAFASPPASLDRRVESVQRAGLGLGMRNLDGPARAFLLDPELGSPLERARAAVLLAPDLPAAHFAHAGALWSESGQWLAALGAFRAGLEAVPRHLEAWLWGRATVLSALAWLCAAAGTAYMLLAAGAMGPRIVALDGSSPALVPPPARFALLGGFVLVPAALGEGLLGVALVCAAVGFGWGTRALRVALGGALLMTGVGLFPLADRAGDAAAGLASEPLAGAVFSVEHGFPNEAELARVARAAVREPLANEALALRERREGDLASARARFAGLVGEADARVLNNAANVQLALGRSQEAIELYERAAAREPSATILFNLAQAYGQTVQLERQDQVLAQAQRIDEAFVADLTRALISVPQVVPLDVPAGVPTLAPMLSDAGEGAALAALWRRQFAPGRLGARPGAFGTGALLALGLGAAGAVVARREHPPAGRARRRRGSSPIVTPLPFAFRLEGVRNLISWLVPGAAGLLRGRPWLGFVGVALATAALATWVHREGVVPDPLAIGLGVDWVAGALLAGLGMLYLAVTTLAVALGERA